MLKHAHKEFPSDLFIVLETVGAKITISKHRLILIEKFPHQHLLFLLTSLLTFNILVNRNREMKELSLSQFLETDMNGKVLLLIKFIPLSTDHVVKSFKIMPRSCNAHAYINAGFCAKISREDVVQIIGKPTIIYGGIRSSLVIIV